MVEDHGTNIQQEDLIGDDVANDLATAMNGGQPVQDPENGTVQTHDEPAVDSAAPSMPARPPISPPTDGDDDTVVTGGDDLHSIKQEALKQLGPLVEHIDQEPQERFDTLMMMIRASDDETLVKPAYEAAQKIEDDSHKAKALLDIVNEVNYLTRPTTDESNDDTSA